MRIAALVRPPAPARVIDPEDIIDVKEAAALFRVSTHTIYLAVENGKLKHYRVPGCSRAIRFLRSELLAQMMEQGQE